MPKVNIDRDETLTYFINDALNISPVMLIDLTDAEIAEFKEIEQKYFAWQTRFDNMHWEAGGYAES